MRAYLLDIVAVVVAAVIAFGVWYASVNDGNVDIMVNSSFAIGPLTAAQADAIMREWKKNGHLAAEPCPA